MSIEFVTVSKFNESPELQREYGSYDKFLQAYTNSLSKTSLMTFVKNNKDTMYIMPRLIRESIWQRSKEADEKKANAEDAYYAARDVESEANYAKDKAETELNKTKTELNRNQSSARAESDYKKAQSAYTDATKNALSAELNRELYGDKWVRASKNATIAYMTGMFADRALNYDA